MEKRRVRLEINGVVCGLITEESDEYMQDLAGEVGLLIRQITEASPYITREAAAVTAALSFCDDLKKNGKRAEELQERVDELEVEAELWQEEKAGMQTAPGQDPALAERVQKLEQENTALAEKARQAEEARRRAEELADENAALREQSAAAPAREDGQDAVLRDKLAELERENARLKAEIAAKPETPHQAAPAPAEAPNPAHRGKNPLRYEDGMEQQGFVSFFERKE